MNRRAFRFGMGLGWCLPFVLALTACGAPGGGGVSVGTSILPQEPAAIRVELSDGTTTAQAPTPNAAPVATPGRQTVVADGWRVTAATLLLERIDVKLPEPDLCRELEEAEGEVGHRAGERLPDACDELNDELSFSGPFEVDLLSGDAVPPLTSVVLPKGVYRKLRLRFGKARVAGARIPEGRTLLLEGRYADGTTDVAVRLLTAFEEQLELERATGITIDDQGGTIVVRLVATRWLGDLGTGMRACLDAGPPRLGQIVDLDEKGKDLPQPCERLLDQVEQAIDDAAELDHEERRDDEGMESGGEDEAGGASREGAPVGSSDRGAGERLEP